MPKKMIKIISPLPVFVVVFVLGIVSVTAQACPYGWFGKDCEYMCHCNGQSCDINGNCPDGSQCDTRWFGPACQYADMTRYSKVERISSLGRSVSAIGTCLGGTNIASVTITLNLKHHFTWMRLIFQEPGYLESITVTFRMGSSPASCPKQSNSSFSDKMLDVHCISGVTIDQVVLTGEGILSLCSVFISGGRNIALKQNATQTNTYDENTADKAVDGDSSGEFKYCACMEKNLKSWMLMFSKSHHIYRFDLYNRGSELYRLQNFVLDSFNESGMNVFNYQENSGRTLRVYTVIPYTSLQNVMKVQISSKTAFFTICETEIYGEVNCPNGKFGRNCEKTCNCADKNEACFVSTGGCPSGCSAGFHGDECNTSCPEHFYGVNCKYPCSQNCSDERCNTVSGVCVDCIPGKQGDFCDQACDPGFYGQACRQICSKNCSGDGSCDGDTGACKKCQDGYRGNTCNETCQANYYGTRCMLPCSVNCTNTTCNHVSGHCYSCVPGMLGPFCDKDHLEYIATSISDDNAPLIAGLVTAAVVIILILVIVALIWRRRRNSSRNSQPQRQIKDDDIEVVFKEPELTKANRDELLPRESDPKNMENALYSNVSKNETEVAMKVKDLHAFLLSHNTDNLRSKFETIPNIYDEATTNVALSDKNKSKNRYKNISPYDHSRVCLTINKEKNEEDYINASYVEGYKKKEKFIASQGPNNSIINDFVRMLWEQKTEKVVMLTKLVEEGKQKCDQYWPTDNRAVFGSILVKLAATQVFADYTIRKLKLKKSGEPSHNITHFHFTSWPDKGVPSTPWALVDFEQRVFAHPTTKPVVVHCSAGVGRTGTFIALHNLIKEAIETDCLDFYNTLVKLRKDRMYMIQTPGQYAFLHKAVEVALLCLKTTISGENIASRMQLLESKVSEMTNMEVEFNSICDVCTEDKNALGENESSGNGNIYENSRAIANKLKNRFSNILANDLYRPQLSDIGDKKSSDYINAVLVPSFTKPSHQILTQLPLPTTVTDFWRLVTQYKVSLIIAFEQDLKTVDSTIGDYLPSGEREPFNCDLFIIKAGSATPGQFWLEQKLTITTNALVKNIEGSASHKIQEHHVTHLKCTSTDLKPSKLLALVEKIRSHNSSDNERTLFMCRNGATYSGLAYILTLLLDRINNDDQLTIPLVVGAIKAIRPQVIPTVEQYGVLYAVLNYYYESTSVYSNIRDTQQL